MNKYTSITKQLEHVQAQTPRKLPNETEDGLTTALQYTVSAWLPECLREARGSSAQLDLLLRTLTTLWMLSLPTGFNLPVAKLAKHMGLRVSTVARHLQTLRKRGLLECIDETTVWGKKARTYRSKGALTDAILADARMRGADPVLYGLVEEPEEAFAEARRRVNRVEGSHASIAKFVEGLTEGVYVLLVADPTTAEGFSALKELDGLPRKVREQVKSLDPYLIPSSSNIAVACSEVAKASRQPVHALLVNSSDFAGFNGRDQFKFVLGLAMLHPGIVFTLVDGYVARAEFPRRECRSLEVASR